MTVFVALHFVIGAGLCFLGFRPLLVGGWKDRLMGLAIFAAGLGGATSGVMIVAELGLSRRGADSVEDRNLAGRGGLCCPVDTG